MADAPNTRAVSHCVLLLLGIVTFAELLGETKVSGLMKQTLAEEKAADRKLMAVAESEINHDAMNAGETVAAKA